jgi:4,5-DOPA dioxygenase extradiol
MMVLEDSPARRFLVGYGDDLPRPEAILVVSAHWETAGIAVNATERPETIYDFFGFPDALYQVRYEAPGAPDLAARAVALLERAGREATMDPHHGLDHGAWSPLVLMYPDADIPVAQLSIQSGLGPRHHFEVGQALAPLRDQGVLILGSGNVTHSLRDMDRSGAEAPGDSFAKRFTDWLAEAIAAGRIEDVIDYRRLAPDAARHHPSEDHFCLC